MIDALNALLFAAFALLLGTVALAIAVGSLPVAVALVLRWSWQLATAPSSPNARYSRPPRYA